MSARLSRHVREIEQDRDSGGVVVGSVVDVAVEDAEVVVVCGDEYILVRRHSARYYTYYIAACDVACRVRRKRLIETVSE